MRAMAIPLHQDLDRPAPPNMRRGGSQPPRTPVGKIAFDSTWHVTSANQDAGVLLQSRRLVGLSRNEIIQRYAGDDWSPLRDAVPPFSVCRLLHIQDRLQPCVLHASYDEGEMVVRFQPADEVALLDHLSDAAGIMDERGLVMSVNDHFAQQFGVCPQEVLGCGAVEVLHRFYPSPSFTPHLLNLVLSGHPWSETPQLLLADGRRHVLRVRLIPWRYEGCICGIVWLASDVTDIADGVQQRTAAVMYRMMATLQHELRNPLQTMQAAVDVLRNDVSLDGQRFLNVLTEHIHLINTGLSDQMLFGVPAQTVFVPGRISEIVAREVQRASLRARTASLRLRHHAPSRDEEPVIRLHNGSIGRVFANLFRNAAQARDDATVDVRYTVDGRWVACSVTDNGPGFPTRFHTAAGTWLGPATAPGKHLGLAIVASTVEAHGGTVSIGNHPRGGARVTLRLPRADGQGGGPPTGIRALDPELRHQSERPAYEWRTS